MHCCNRLRDNAHPVPLIERKRATGAGRTGQLAKQPYAIAMKDGSPFGIGGIWENWKEPASGEWVRTFAVITTAANELVADIHDRMPLILAPGDYACTIAARLRSIAGCR